MPVTLADIRARVSKVLKRNHVTNSDLDEWISDGVRRIQRTLRVPIFDASATATVDASFEGRVAIPSNLLNLQSLQADGIELSMRAITEIKQLQEIGSPSIARYYAREVQNYLIAPIPPIGTKITVLYVAAENEIGDANTSLKLFNVAADLVMYSALIRAADWSLDDPRLAKWVSMYNALFVELQDMSDRDELLHASIKPYYNSNGDWH